MPNGYCSVVARNNSILKQLVLQAKKEYEAEAVHRIQIYFADSYGSWRYTDSRHKRPLSSIVLNPGVKEMLVADAKDFLKSEKVGVYCHSKLFHWLTFRNSGMRTEASPSVVATCCTAFPARGSRRSFTLLLENLCSIYTSCLCRPPG